LSFQENDAWGPEYGDYRRHGGRVWEQGKIARMKLGSFDVLVHALDKGRVRYLVAGGLAVNAHGYLRFTRDVDLVIQLDPDNVIAAFRAMEGWCDAHPDTPVDVFVTEPFDFDEEYARALVKPLGAVAVRFVSIPSLIRMKEIAGRPQDKIDIDYLRKLADAGK
jgi:hypothetical protein